MDKSDNIVKKGSHAPTSTKGSHAPASTKGSDAPTNTKGSHAPASTKGNDAPASTKGNDAPASTKGSHAPASTKGNAHSSEHSQKAEAALGTATKAMEYVRGAGFKYLHLGKITLERRELEQKRLEVLQKIGLQCVQSIQDGTPLDDTLFKTLYDSHARIVQSMDDLNHEKDSVKKIDPADIKSKKYDS